MNDAKDLAQKINRDMFLLFADMLDDFATKPDMKRFDGEAALIMVAELIREEFGG